MFSFCRVTLNTTITVTSNPSGCASNATGARVFAQGTDGQVRRSPNHQVQFPLFHSPFCHVSFPFLHVSFPILHVSFPILHAGIHVHPDRVD